MDDAFILMIFHCLFDGVALNQDQLESDGLGISQQDITDENARIVLGVSQMIKPEYQELFKKALQERILGGTR